MILLNPTLNARTRSRTLTHARTHTRSRTQSRARTHAIARAHAPDRTRARPHARTTRGPPAATERVWVDSARPRSEHKLFTRTFLRKLITETFYGNFSRKRLRMASSHGNIKDSRGSRPARRVLVGSAERGFGGQAGLGRGRLVARGVPPCAAGTDTRIKSRPAGTDTRIKSRPGGTESRVSRGRGSQEPWAEAVSSPAPLSPLFRRAPGPKHGF